MIRQHRPAVLENGFAKLPLGVNAKNGYAIVDIDRSFLDNHKWYLSKRGYPVTNISNKKVRLHDLIIGNATNGMVTDHINRNKLDNRADNLRHITQLKNVCNTASKGGTSKYKGVSFDKDRNKWASGIMVNRKRIALGRFSNEIEAALAYDKSAKKYWGEFAYLNKPDGTTL